MKVKITVIPDNLGMKEKIRIQHAIKQQQEPELDQRLVDRHRHRHIMQRKNILVREEGLILQIQKMAMAEMNLKETVDEVVDNLEEAVVEIPSPSIFLREIATTIIENPKIVTMVETITKNPATTEIQIMKQDTQKRTAKTMTIAKVKKATPAIQTAEEIKEAINQISLRIAMRKISQMKKEVSEPETECLKNLILNNVKIFHLECL